MNHKQNLAGTKHHAANTHLCLLVLPMTSSRRQREHDTAQQNLSGLDKIDTLTSCTAETDVLAQCAAVNGVLLYTGCELARVERAARPLRPARLQPTCPPPALRSGVHTLQTTNRKAAARSRVSA